MRYLLIDEGRVGIFFFYYKEGIGPRGKENYDEINRKVELLKISDTNNCTS
jgi:hypothetical protein